MNLKIENVMELNEFFSDIEVRNGEDSQKLLGAYLYRSFATVKPLANAYVNVINTLENPVDRIRIPLMLAYMKRLAIDNPAAHAIIDS